MHRGTLLAFALGAACVAAACGGAEQTSQSAGVAQANAAASPSPSSAAAAPASSVQHGLAERPPDGGIFWGQPGQNGAAPAALPPQPTPDDARRISIDDTLPLVQQGKAVVVDVRDADSYSRGHVRGALSIPEMELPQRLGELPKGKLIITYCA